MSEMIERAYYRSKGAGMASDLIAEWEEAREPLNALGRYILNKFDADSSYGSGGCISALLVSGDSPSRRGMKRNVELIEGELYTKFSPDRRYREGKLLSLWIGKFNDMHDEKSPEFSVFLIRKAGVRKASVFGISSRGRHVRAYATAGACASEKFTVLNIPYTKESPGDIDGYLRIKKSEFINLTEEENIND